MTESVYRRGPRSFYGSRKTRGWIGTFQTAVFGTPTDCPEIVLTGAEGRAVVTEAEGILASLGTAGSASLAGTEGTAVLVGVEGRATLEEC